MASVSIRQLSAFHPWFFSSDSGGASTQPEKSPRSERYLHGGREMGKAHCVGGGECGSCLKPIATSRDHQFSCFLGKKCPPARHINLYGTPYPLTLTVRAFVQRILYSYIMPLLNYPPIFTWYEDGARSLPPLECCFASSALRPLKLPRYGTPLSRPCRSMRFRLGPRGNTTPPEPKDACHFTQGLRYISAPRAQFTMAKFV